MLWLPDAIRDDHGDRLAWTETSDPKGCLHTTEGGGWPDYQGWTVEPHATIRPLPGVGVEVRQHVPFSHASFSLRHTAAQATNTDYCFQFELIGTCNPTMAHQLYYWPVADDAVLADLHRKVIEPVSDAFGIPMRAVPFLAYPASGRSDSPVRLSDHGFDVYSGWLGHQHVPQNDHGDPGLFPWSRMAALAQGVDMPLTTDDKAWISAAIAAGISGHKIASADARFNGWTLDHALDWMLRTALDTNSDENGDLVAQGEIKTMLTTLLQQPLVDPHAIATALAPLLPAAVDVQALAAALAPLLPAGPTAGDIGAELARRLTE